jgi:hypothetical protein
MDVPRLVARRALSPRGPIAYARDTPMRTLTSLVAVMALAGCARTSSREAADAADVPVAPDAAVVDAAGAPPIEAAFPPGCVWTASPPVALTERDFDRSPSAVRVLDDRLWVGFQGSFDDPPGNRAGFVRVTDALGRPLAPPVDFFPSIDSRTRYGRLSLWTDATTRLHGAMYDVDRAGCIAVPLDDDARPSGTFVRLDGRRLPWEEPGCSGLVRQRDAWSYLAGNAVAGRPASYLHVVTSEDVATAVPLTPDDETMLSSARLVADGGAFLLAWSGTSPANADPRVRLRRYDPRGAPLSGITTLAPLHAGWSVRDLRLVADRGGALVGWSESAPGERLEFVVARVDAVGRPLVVPTRVLNTPMPRDEPSDVGLAVARGVPAVIWNPYDTFAPERLRLTTLDPATLRPVATADAAPLNRLENVSLHGTSQGFVAVYGAVAEPAVTRVWTAAFRCVAP